MKLRTQDSNQFGNTEAEASSGSKKGKEVAEDSTTVLNELLSSGVEETGIERRKFTKVETSIFNGTDPDPPFRAE